MACCGCFPCEGVDSVFIFKCDIGCGEHLVISGIYIFDFRRAGEFALADGYRQLSSSGSACVDGLGHMGACRGCAASDNGFSAFDLDAPCQ